MSLQVLRRIPCLRIPKNHKLVYYTLAVYADKDSHRTRLSLRSISTYTDLRAIAKG